VQTNEPVKRQSRKRIVKHTKLRFPLRARSVIMPRVRAMERPVAGMAAFWFDAALDMSMVLTAGFIVVALAVLELDGVSMTQEVEVIGRGVVWPVKVSVCALPRVKEELA
jgi:hypothetical protein